MRTLRFLLEKEFRQIFRDRTILTMILVMPIIQLTILPLAADYDIKKINVSIVDHDHSSLSRELRATIGSSGYFILPENTNSYAAALDLVEKGRVDIIVEIPARFEQGIARKQSQQILLAADAINGTKAGLGVAYLSSIINQFNASTRVQRLAQPEAAPAGRIGVTNQVWFNPLMNYRFFMVPGILVILVTLVAGFMSALNIVREKEIGTIEQINVSPIKKYQFLLGKMIPFWVLGIFVFSIGLLVARFIYGIVPVSNLGILYLFLAVYLMAILGFGLLVSTYCDNQLQSMFVAFFFIMIFILMSGLFTPIESMPAWARFMAHCTPVSYFIEVMRLTVLKGSRLTDILPQLGMISLFALILNGWAVLNYSKTN